MPTIGTQVLRIEKRDSSLVGGGLGRHNRGDSRPPHAKPRDGLDPVVELFNNRAAGEMVLAKGAALPKRAGRQPSPAVELVFAGFPRYEAEDGGVSHERGRIDAFCADVVDWLKEVTSGRGGFRPATLVEVHLHQDEAAPNIHASIVPATLDDPRPSPVELEHAIVGERVDEHWTRASRMQTAFYEAVASKHGLARGEIGSNARHQPTDVVKGMHTRIEETEARARESEAAAGAKARAAEERLESARAAGEEELRAGRAALQAKLDAAERRLRAAAAGKRKAEEKAAKLAEKLRIQKQVTANERKKRIELQQEDALRQLGVPDDTVPDPSPAPPKPARSVAQAAPPASPRRSG